MNVYPASIEVTDAIFNRRAVRRFQDLAVNPAAIQELLNAAVQAPSALNQQPWAFAVIHGRKQLHEYSEQAKRFLLTNYPPTFELNPRSQMYENPDYDIFHGANTLVVIYATPGRHHPNEDCCLAAENLMLAAYAMDLATCPIGFARPWLDQWETKHQLGVPEHYTAVFPLVVGYPAEKPERTVRNSPEIVCWRWDAE